MKTLAKLKKRILRDPEMKREYNRLYPEYALIETVIKKRSSKKMTQKELAQKIGTRQSAISRLESGSANPSFRFLQKVAAALGARLTVSFH